MTARARKQPIWILRPVVEAAHHDQILEHGGLPGIRDEAGLDAALAWARNKWEYEAAAMPVLVAAYGFGIANSHPFNDGNKRAAFLAMAVFAERNGFSIAATDVEIVETIVGLAEGRVTEAALVEWIAPRLKKKGRAASA